QGEATRPRLPRGPRCDCASKGDAPAREGPPGLHVQARASERGGALKIDLPLRRAVHHHEARCGTGDRRALTEADLKAIRRELWISHRRSIRGSKLDGLVHTALLDAHLANFGA